MDNNKILEMLNGGQIEELKGKIQDEIFQEELKKSGGTDAKKRYSAMKRYFKYVGGFDDRLFYPYKNLLVEIRGEQKEMNCFLNGHSFVLTPENIGNMEYFSSVADGKEYFNVQSMLNIPFNYEEVDLNKVLSAAKAKGYKYKGSELDNWKFTYAWHYKDAYFKVGILDQAYAIVNDGQKSKIYYTSGVSPLYIETSIGLACILPMHWDTGVGKIVIETEGQSDELCFFGKEME